VSLESENGEAQFARDILAVHVLPEPGREPGEVAEQIRRRVKFFTEVTPDRVVFEDNEPEFEKRLFARNGIKAEYVVERRKEHI
jgi:hypothetical protein